MRSRKRAPLMERIPADRAKRWTLNAEANGLIRRDSIVTRTGGYARPGELRGEGKDRHTLAEHNRFYQYHGHGRDAHEDSWSSRCHNARSSMCVWNFGEISTGSLRLPAAIPIHDARHC